MVVVYSGHCGRLRDRRYFGHLQLYKVQLTVPLLILIPGMHPAIIPGPVVMIDLMPTLLSLFQQTVPESIQGMALSPFLFPGNKNALPGDRVHLSETKYRAIQCSDGWKFILRDAAQNDELYFLKDDPEEVRNLATEKEPEVDRMRKLFQDVLGMDIARLRIPNQHADVVHIKGPEKTKLRRQLKSLGYIDK